MAFNPSPWAPARQFSLPDPDQALMMQFGLPPQGDDAAPTVVSQPVPTGVAAYDAKAKAIAAQAQAGVVSPTVAPVAKGSGQSASAENSGQMKQQGQVVRKLMDTPEEYAKGIASIMDTKPFQDQQHGIDRLDDLMRVIPLPQAQVDLTPLGDLANYVTGGKYKSNYKAPADVSAQLDKVRAYAEKIQDDRRDVMKTATAGYQGLKAGSVTDMYQAILAQKAAEGAFDPNKFIRGQGAAKPKQLSDGAIDKLTQGQGALALTDKLIAAVGGHPELMGTGKGAIAGVSSWLGTDFGSKKVAAMQDLQNDFGLLQQTVGKLFEGGVLRKEDEIKYNRLLGSLGRDPNVTARNLAELRTKLAQDVGNHLANQGKAGRDVSQFGDLQKALNKASAPGFKPAGTDLAPPPGRTKALDKMTKAELDAYEASLQGGN